MKSTLYVETSIVSYLTARRSRDIITAARQEITREWWNVRRTNFQLFTSEFVIEEAEEGDPEAARRRLDALTEAEKLDLHDEARPLARKLVEKGPLPAKAALDALHIAVSATSGMDYWRVNRHSWCGSDLKTPGMSSRAESRDLPDTSCCFREDPSALVGMTYL